MTSRLQIVIPMAGSGDRFKKAGYTNPKPMIDIMGIPMIRWAVETLGLQGDYTFVASHYETREENQQVYNELRNLMPDCTIIQLFDLTAGPAATCMHAQKYLDPERPLLITNCDQVLEWDSSAFLNYAHASDYDGIVVTYHSTTPKNSYIKLDAQGYGIRLAEKEVISHHSLNGVHFWKKARYFLESTQRMIEADTRVNDEFYISMTFNEMIGSGLKVGAYRIPSEQHHAIGTPEDLQKFLDRFCDEDS